MNLIELLKVIVIGIVEGITEWLPISSTGHMLLVDEIFTLNMPEEFKEMFFVVIQLGAILAVVVVFWERLWPFRFKEIPVIQKDIFTMWFKVVVGCIPAGVLGLLFDDFLEAHFGTPMTIAVMLIVYGIAFIVIENRNKGRVPAVDSIDALSYKTALIIGFFQALAMIPGTSRSGATIIGGLLLGVSRTAASEFTFFLAIPTMLGASLVKLLKFGFAFTGDQLITLVVGMAVAFAVSVASIRFLMSYVRRHDFKIFGWYRIVLGAIVIALSVL
ncbi:MAG: undecaprenyl-diphosphate phosphatase [Oscillospiraceae bacterium]|nr:undecaprenyl-diphosphate phosphatase [Oscillospiraceae bacterium]